jgi:hypothetical protein
MKKLEWFLKNSGYFGAVYLGIILGIYTTFLHWQWWVIVLPTLFFFALEISYHNYKNK